MESVDLRDFGRQAAELVRRAEAGEEFLITSAGRPVAKLVPPKPRSWRRWPDVAEVFAGSGDPNLQHERVEIEDGVIDPWDPSAGR
ncbi:type II toxin-antitoxin system Phd/YefM family antitoxin [Mycolicibacterium baixiangningiae]|uniref:type II toxin-antitoxin system Phd/YefM family antitoxin n=1 Tax=Mycolicibacterium baixiangningiae TaxID=2761578 RepID=UPI0018661D08|nr:type II toxin-antitoxin system prevent-host-death family antitoxin [Mycolicibacterium baixiangningiae]